MAPFFCFKIMFLSKIFANYKVFSTKKKVIRYMNVTS